MIDILLNIIGVTTLIFLALICWESSKMIDEKKKRRRNGTHDYYDNEIKKDE